VEERSTDDAHVARDDAAAEDASPSQGHMPGYLHETHRAYSGRDGQLLALFTAIGRIIAHPFRYRKNRMP
jgi:hypothetical protein